MTCAYEAIGGERSRPWPCSPRMGRWVTAGALALMAFARVPEASAGDAALAEVLFRQGRTLMEAGNHAEACPKLAESYVQDPATGTLLALAVCQEESGLTASAWASYAEVVSRSRQEGRADREASARGRMTDLEPGLSRLEVKVSPEAGAIPGLTVKRNGVAVGRAAWGVAAPVDPGEYLIEAVAPGKRPFATKVTVGSDGDAGSVLIAALEDESGDPTSAGAPSSAVVATPVVANAPRAVEADDGTSASMPPLRTIGLVAGGAGLVGLGVGSYFGLRAMSLKADSNAEGRCDADNSCNEEGTALRRDAIAASTVSTIAFAAGGVLAAAGVTLFIIGGSETSERGARVTAVPVVGAGEAAMSLRGRF
jgi:hypothetical protein